MNNANTMNSEKFKDIVEYIINDFRNNTEIGYVANDIRELSSYLRFIRNNFRMWKDEWEPVLIDGIDFSPMHPDNLSKIAFDMALQVLKYRGDCDE